MTKLWTRRATFALGAGAGLAAITRPGFAQQGHPRAAQPFQCGVEVGFAPFAYRRPTGELVGFSIDAANEIGRRLGRPSTEIIDVPFSAAFAGLFASRFETFVGPVNITPERAGQMLFSEGYMETGLGFLVARAAPAVSGPQDLRGRAVAVNRGSVSDTWATENATAMGFEVQRYNSNPDAVQAVLTNRAFANIADLPVTRYVATQQPLTRVGFIVPNGRFFGYPFRLDNEPLRNAVDAIVEQMKTDGAYARIHQTHFGVPPDAGSIMTRPIPGRGQPDFAGYRAP